MTETAPDLSDAATIPRIRPDKLTLAGKLKRSQVRHGSLVAVPQGRKNLFTLVQPHAD